MKNARGIYFANNKEAQRTLQKIILWKDSMSLRKNAQRLGITESYAYRFSYLYHLPFQGMRHDANK